MQQTQARVLNRRALRPLEFLVLLPLLCTPKREWQIPTVALLIEQTEDVVTDTLQSLEALGYVKADVRKCENGSENRAHVRASVKAILELGYRAKSVLGCGIDVTIEHVIVITRTFNYLGRRGESTG